MNTTWVIIFEYVSGPPLAVVNDEDQAKALCDLINRGRRGTDAPEAVAMEVQVMDPRLKLT